jgi:hypothetical protein
MGPYLVNPLSIGIPSSGTSSSSGAMGSSKPTFGQALYSTTSGSSQFGSTSGQSNFGGSSSRAGGTSRSGSTATGGFSGSSSGNRSSYGNSGGSSGFNGGLGGALGGAAGSVSSAYAPRAVAFTTTVGYPMPATEPTRMRADLQAVIAQTSALPSRERIQTLEQGDAIVLRGSVGSLQERQLAEAILRLSPGVFNVRNELEVPEPTPPPRPTP